MYGTILQNPNQQTQNSLKHMKKQFQLNVSYVLKRIYKDVPLCIAPKENSFFHIIHIV
jgi:hypothetical protein